MHNPNKPPPDAAPPPPPLTRREARAVESFAFLAAALAESLQSPELTRALAAGGVAGRVARATGLDLSSVARVRVAHVRRLLDVLPPGPDWGDDDNGDEPGGPGGGDGLPELPTAPPHGVRPWKRRASWRSRPARRAVRGRVLPAPVRTATPEGSR